MVNPVLRRLKVNPAPRHWGQVQSKLTIVIVIIIMNTGERSDQHTRDDTVINSCLISSHLFTPWFQPGDIFSKIPRLPVISGSVTILLPETDPVTMTTVITGQVVHGWADVWLIIIEATVSGQLVQSLPIALQLYFT